MRKIVVMLLLAALAFAAPAERARSARGHASAPPVSHAHAAARTTWSPHEVTCPVCGTKNTFMQIMSFGNYIYQWPSKFQSIYWPLTDSNVLYSCKKCRLTALMGDYEEVPKEKLPALMKLLEALPAAKPFEKYTDVPMSERLLIAEKVYALLGGRDDDWWGIFYRTEGYHFQREKRQAEADAARRKALALAEKQLADKANEDRRKQLMLITGGMKYFLDDEAGALADLESALKLKFRNPKDEKGSENYDKYLTEVLEQFVAGIRDEIKARSEPVWPHRVFEEHEKWVWGAAFSPDGRTVASGDTDGLIVLRDAETGAVRHRLKHGTAVLGLAFSPGGEAVVSCGYAGTLKVWDARTGELSRELGGHAEHVAGVAFSRDGRLMASGDWGGALNLWDAAAWKISRTLKAGKSVRDLALSGDGATVAAVDFDGVIRLWDARAGALRLTVPTNKEASFVALSPDGLVLATDSEGAALVLLDARTGNVLRKLAGHSQSPSAAAFAPDGGRVASVAWDGTLRLWNPETGQALQVLTERGHHFRVVAFSPDGQRIATGSDDRTFRLWDVRPGAKPEVPAASAKTPRIKDAQ